MLGLHMTPGKSARLGNRIRDFHMQTNDDG